MGAVAALGAWLAKVPRKAQIAILGAILAAGALLWAHHAGYNAGTADERLANDRARVQVAETARKVAGAAVTTAIAAAKPVTRAAQALHDTVKVVDTVTVSITVPAPPGSVSTIQNFTLPSVVVRRIVADSADLVAKVRIINAQAAELRADTVTIAALTRENATLAARKTPTCGGKCRVGVAIVKVAVVAEAAVRVVRWLKPHR